LDHWAYYKSILVDQDQIGLVVLDRVLRAWFDEAIVIKRFSPFFYLSVEIAQGGASGKTVSSA
jgi:hypothetical protein